MKGVACSRALQPPALYYVGSYSSHIHKLHKSSSSSLSPPSICLSLSFHLPPLIPTSSPPSPTGCFSYFFLSLSPHPFPFSFLLLSLSLSFFFLFFTVPIIRLRFSDATLPCGKKRERERGFSLPFLRSPFFPAVARATAGFHGVIVSLARESV